MNIYQTIQSKQGSYVNTAWLNLFGCLWWNHPVLVQILNFSHVLVFSEIYFRM